MGFPESVWDKLTRLRTSLDVRVSPGPDDFEEAVDELVAVQDYLVGRIGTIGIPLGAITREDGTALTKQATDVAGYAQIGNKEQVINIPINCSAGEELGFSVPLPADLDVANPVTLHVLASKAANLDVLTLDAEMFFVGVGDLQNGDAQTEAAQTIVAGGTELVFSATPLAAPGSVTCVLLLGGTNDGDAVYIHGVWLEYTKSLA